MQKRKIVKISIPSRIEAIDLAVRKAIEFASSLSFDESELYAIDLAVREAVANAVKHGNMLDESKKVEITLKNLKEGLEVKVKDSGKGFNIEEVPDPTKPENLLKPNGKGILFMRHFMEKVEWKRNRKGMTVKMLKIRRIC